MGQTVVPESPPSGRATGTPSLPIWRVRSYGFDDRFWQAKTARAARWRDFKAAWEVGYWRDGFQSYLADCQGVEKTAYSPDKAGDTAHWPYIPPSALLPVDANAARPEPADGKSRADLNPLPHNLGDGR